MPQKAFDAALERLRNYVANTSEVEAGQAPRWPMPPMFLARNGTPVMGDLRYLADATARRLREPAGARATRRRARACLAIAAARRKVFSSSRRNLAQAQIGNPLYSHANYGSRLRDGAGLLSACRRGRRCQCRQIAAGVENRRRRARENRSREHAGKRLDGSRRRGHRRQSDARSLSPSMARPSRAPSSGPGAPPRWATKRQDRQQRRTPVIVLLTTSGNP